MQHAPYVPPPIAGPIFTRENLSESAWPDRINEATRELNSRDPGTVIKGLNTLLMKSFESDTGITLQIENYPDLLTALGSLLDALNPIGNMLFHESIIDIDASVEVGIKRKIDSDDSYVRSSLRSDETENKWTSALPSDGNQLFKVRKFIFI